MSGWRIYLADGSTIAKGDQHVEGVLKVWREETHGLRVLAVDDATAKVVGAVLVPWRRVARIETWGQR